MTDLTQPLAEHAVSYDSARLTPAVLDHISLDLADAIAAIVGGSSAPGVPETREVVRGFSAAGTARVFTTNLTLPAVAAAQANATAGHALDFDDTLDEGGGMHAGVAVHSAALAIADELGGVSGAEYAAAVAVGLDVAVRLALAPTQDFGWHRTSAFGIFGVTVAVGRLLKLDVPQMANALGIAYSQASGNRQCIPDGALSKRLQSGFGARDGITAVLLARAGLTGASNAFEGRDGFFNLYQRGQYTRETVTNGLGEELLSTRISIKPYPCGRNLHTLLDAALDVQARGGSADIEEITVGLEPTAAARANLNYPEHVVQAQFSAPFAASLALATGATAVGHFDQPDQTPAEARALFDRVKVVANDASGWGTKVSVRYSDGRTVSSEAQVAKGNPQKPLTAADIESKAIDCNSFAGKPLSDDTISEAIALAINLRSLATTTQLTGQLAKA